MISGKFEPLSLPLFDELSQIAANLSEVYDKNLQDLLRQYQNIRLEPG
jgi:hypothetical protein